MRADGAVDLGFVKDHLLLDGFGQHVLNDLLEWLLLRVAEGIERLGELAEDLLANSHSLN